jgi:hypothetical protein
MVRLVSIKRTYPSLLKYLNPLSPYPSWIPYYHWRHSEIFAAIFNVAGLITATIDYEHRYDKDRTHENCSEGESTEIYRWWTLMFTGMAIVFTIARYYLKLQWFKKKQPKYSKIIWTYEVYRLKRFKAAYRVCLEVAYLCIFPYPNLKPSSNFATVENMVVVVDNLRYNVCYTTAELLYVLMYFRIILLIRALLTGTQFQDDLSNYVCNQFRQSANFIFTIKCLMRNSPLKFSVFAIVPCVFMFGTLIRIFERPFMDISGADFDSYMNAVWCASVTITTIGYGDIKPYTQFGRMIVLICVFWGLFVFSLLVSALDNAFQLNTKQNKAFIKIRRIRASAYLIRAALQYNHAKRIYGTDDPATTELYEYMLREVEIHKQKVIRTKKIKSEQKSGMFTLSTKMTELSKQLTRIEQRLGMGARVSFESPL